MAQALRRARRRRGGGSAWPRCAPAARGRHLKRARRRVRPRAMPTASGSAGASARAARALPDLDSLGRQMKDGAGEADDEFIGTTLPNTCGWLAFWRWPPGKPPATVVNYVWKYGDPFAVSIRHCLAAPTPDRKRVWNAGRFLEGTGARRRSLQRLPASLRRGGQEGTRLPLLPRLRLAGQAQSLRSRS